MFVMGLKNAKLGVRAWDAVSREENGELRGHCEYTLSQPLGWSHGHRTRHPEPGCLLKGRGWA